MIESERRWRDHADPSTAEIFDLVARFNTALADAVARTLRDGEFPIVLGGDHANRHGHVGRRRARPSATSRLA